jgi:hypothetical protein
MMKRADTDAARQMFLEDSDLWPSSSRPGRKPPRRCTRVRLPGADCPLTGRQPRDDDHDTV